MARVKFIRSEEPNIIQQNTNKSGIDGAIYVATDTGSMWMGKKDKTLLLLNKNIKLYTSTGNNTDGSIDQKTTTELLNEKANVEHTHDYIPTSQKGIKNGVAELDENGKVPSAQLPSYVDDVVEYDAESNFPSSGESGKIYVDTSTNLTYRWSGTGYVEISPSVALGTNSSTAFYGDKGQAAYEHSQSTGNPHNTTISDISNLQSILDSKVPITRKINGKELSSDITLSASDVGAATSDHTHNSVKYAETAGTANTASVANCVAWDNVTGAPTFPDVSEYVKHEAIEEYVSPDNKINVELINGLDTYINTVVDISNCVTIDQLKTILASATIDSTGKLTFTV